MADAVVTTIALQGQDKLVLRMTCVSDATGETDVVKLNLATILNQVGLAAVRFGILEAWWSIQGFTSVRLEADHTTDDVLMVLGAGNSYRDFRDTNPFMDPQSAGGTGNLLLTSVGATATATYDISLTLAIRFPQGT